MNPIALQRPYGRTEATNNLESQGDEAWALYPPRSWRLTRGISCFHPLDSRKNPDEFLSSGGFSGRFCYVYSGSRRTIFYSQRCGMTSQVIDGVRLDHRLFWVCKSSTCKTGVTPNNVTEADSLGIMICTLNLLPRSLNPTSQAICSGGVLPFINPISGTFYAD